MKTIHRTSFLTLLAMSACGSSTTIYEVAPTITMEDAGPTTLDAGESVITEDAGRDSGDGGSHPTLQDDGGTAVPTTDASPDVVSVQDAGTTQVDSGPTQVDSGTNYYCTECAQLVYEYATKTVGCVTYNTQPCDTVIAGDYSNPRITPQTIILTDAGGNDAGLPYIRCNLYTDEFLVNRTSCTFPNQPSLGSAGGIVSLTTTTIPTNPGVCSGMVCAMDGGS